MGTTEWAGVGLQSGFQTRGSKRSELVQVESRKVTAAQDHASRTVGSGGSHPRGLFSGRNGPKVKITLDFPSQLPLMVRNLVANDPAVVGLVRSDF